MYPDPQYYNMTASTMKYCHVRIVANRPETYGTIPDLEALSRIPKFT